MQFHHQDAFAITTRSLAIGDTTTIFDSTFALDSDGFTYIDDLFMGTSQPDYASGSFNATIGQNGGGVSVLLGGVDKNDIQNMSVRN